MISEKGHITRCMFFQGAHVAPKVSIRLTKNLIISALKLASCELVVFRDMNTYMLKGRDFKTFLKENYAVTLESYYMFIEHDADSAYGVCIY